MKSLLALWLLALGFVSQYAHFSGGAELNEFVRYYEPLVLRAHSSWETQDKLASTFHFRAHGRDFRLHVETHTTLFHPDFHVVVVEEGGKVMRKTIDTRAIVAGHVEGEEDSAVYGYLRNGTLDGIIHSQGETFHLEPLSRHLPGETGTHNTIIYKSSDVVYDLEHTACSSLQSPRLRHIQESASFSHWFSHSELRRRKRTIDPNRNTCTIKVVADHLFFDEVGDSQESTTVAEMALHIMDANDIYRSTDFISNGGQFSGFGLSLHSTEIYKSQNPAENPLVGQFSVEELLEAFSAENFDDVCLAHLFTYRDFQGTIGLAYVGDPNGVLVGGICQKRTLTLMGERNLNTGFTSFENFGRRLPRAVSFITVAHEVGHNHGSQHDPPGPCAPGGTEGNYIMFASATDGSRPNNRLFSQCSRDSMGQTIDVNGDCFVPKPTSDVCGNGIIEGNEACDCGSSDAEECFQRDPCCNPGNCTLRAGALCSAEASPCCNATFCGFTANGVVCHRGDIDLGGCLFGSVCSGENASCPDPRQEEDGTLCNFGSNVCIGGACTGSLCASHPGISQECYCSDEEHLCDICCVFGNGECRPISEIEGVNRTFVSPGYPCRNFTGYCTDDHTCIFIDNNTPINNLRDIFLKLGSTLLEWLRNNWYWVLAGCVGVVILMILLQITYRRKKLNDEDSGRGKWWRRRKSPQRRRRGAQSYGYYQTTEEGQLETTSLVVRNEQEQRPIRT